MVEARVDDERLAVEVELRPLVPALVDREQQPVVRQQEAVDRLREIGQLLEAAAVQRQPEQLPRPRQVGRDEQPRAVGRERERPGLPQLEELSERARQRPRRAPG
ncbi:MAG: hypothetical protein JO073_07635 [Actinobacteria bacterium]|nr:hypothetical protein [Actinomycetota bacterium]